MLDGIPSLVFCCFGEICEDKCRSSAEDGSAEDVSNIAVMRANSMGYVGVCSVVVSANSGCCWRGHAERKGKSLFCQQGRLF